MATNAHTITLESHWQRRESARPAMLNTCIRQLRSAFLGGNSQEKNLRLYWEDRSLVFLHAVRHLTAGALIWQIARWRARILDSISWNLVVILQAAS